jgi:drug/metabolite transporter (DMT)-like permease
MELPPEAVAAAIASAVIHAGWNAVLKSGADRLADGALMTVATAALGALVLLVVPFPAPESWPFLLVSGCVHTAYWLTLIASYGKGDLSHIYTIARGTPPIVIALVSLILLSEPLTAGGYAGVALVTCGILLVGASVHAPWRATLWALGTAGFIVCYTLLDGLGARSAGNAVGYTAALFVVYAVPVTVAILWMRGPAPFLQPPARWTLPALSGLVSAFGYGLSVWAQTIAPIAAVSALRETSVVFAAVIAWALLGERVTPRRALGAAVVAAGAACIKLL